MYFLVNLSAPKLLDKATSNFASAYFTLCRGHWAIFCVTLGQSGYIRLINQEIAYWSSYRSHVSCKLTTHASSKCSDG